MCMKKSLFCIFLSAFVVFSAFAQQLPDSHFENWGDKFNGDKQLTDWHGSNVNQAGFKFTFMYQKPGRTGFSAYVTDRAVGIPKLGIGAIGPGYLSLGTPWQYLKSVTKVSQATAGTEGGIPWKYRPDTMAVWVKRVGPAPEKEDFHLLYYAWSGNSKGTEYKNKKGGCTYTERINEESDIRQKTDGNECTVETRAKQIAEGWHRARAKYDEWTLIKVPIFYMSDAKPTMCNVIFSAGNYPAFRANDGMYDGNALYVDDVELIYSSKIDKFVINGKEWKEFNPDSEKLQTFKLSNSEAQSINIDAFRGIGQLTNIKGETAKFKGRKLDKQEMTITPGELNGKPWVIVVKAEDGSSVHTYKVKIER